MQLFKAHNQWNKRPRDERFWTLADGKLVARGHRMSAVEKSVRFADLRVEAVDGDVKLVGKAGIPARLTHHSFGQLCARAGAPASYLRELPATLAVQNMNHGLRHNTDQEASANLLMHVNGDYLLRAATTEKYARLWNESLFELLETLSADGWRPPPGRRPWNEEIARDLETRRATAADALLSLNVKEGEEIVPSGVYVSDKDCFVFLVHPDRVIDGGQDSKLVRGMMAWNSEVGDRALGFMDFLFDGACGNHICHNAKNVREFTVRHVGDAEKRLAQTVVDFKRYADESSSDIEAKIKTARRMVLGATKDEAVAALFDIVTKKRIDISKKKLDEAMTIAEGVERYGDPKSVWGVVNGLTELSQRTLYADERVKIDRATGRILDIAF